MPARLLSFLLVLDCLIDPANKIFGIKELLFFGLFVWGVVCKLLTEGKLRRDFIIAISGIAVILFAGYIRGFLNTELFNAAFGLSYLKAFLFLLILVVDEECGEALRESLMKGLLLLAFITIGIGMFSNSGQPWLNSLTYYLTYEADSAKIATRIYGSFTVPMIYFKSSPLLVLAIPYFMNRERGAKGLLCSIACLAAMMLSGTRANMIIGCILFVAAFYISRPRHRFAIAMIGLPAVVIGLVLLGPSFFNSHEYSNSVKLSHFADYLSMFDFDTLLIGRGIGTGFYSTAWKTITYNTELTYLDMIRVFGIIPMLLLSLLLFFPGFALLRLRKDIAFGYFSYLVIAGTNPLLISSTGMLAIVYAYSVCYWVKCGEPVGSGAITHIVNMEAPAMQ